jgi:hypothetical protein
LFRGDIIIFFAKNAQALIDFPEFDGKSSKLDDDWLDIINQNAAAQQETC